MASSIYTIFESRAQGMTRELIEQFKQKAAADGITPTTALVRLMRAYIASPPGSLAHAAPADPQSPP